MVYRVYISHKCICARGVLGVEVHFPQTFMPAAWIPKIVDLYINILIKLLIEVKMYHTI